MKAIVLQYKFQFGTKFVFAGYGFYDKTEIIVAFLKLIYTVSGVKKVLFNST